MFALLPYLEYIVALESKPPISSQDEVEITAREVLTFIHSIAVLCQSSRVRITDLSVNAHLSPNAVVVNSLFNLSYVR